MQYQLRILSIIFCMALVSCNCNPFEDVSVGISSKQLTDIVGEPDSICDEFFNQVWHYKTHLVTIENDTVKQVSSIAEIKAEIIRMQQEYNKIRGFE